MSKIITLSVILSLFQLILGAVEIDNFNSPLVQVKHGVLKGIISKSRSGRDFYAFLGVPYAEIPKRFEVSRMVEKWTGIKETTKHGDICAQFEVLYHEVQGSENCLFVNVHVPEGGSKKKPVIVFFHGGGFMFGAGEFYGPRYYMDEDVILVTVNYRVSALGFLSTQDEILPGNLGVKDQSLALRWVKENVEYFGGDSNKIAISGNSAGGASVTYQMISPMSKGLFNYAISQSGTCLCPWGFQRSPLDNAIKFATRLGCTTDNSKDMIECLKKVELKKFVEGELVFEKWNGEPMFSFAPSIEPEDTPNPFITESPFQLIKKGKIANKVPWLTGFNEDEGLMLHTGKFQTNTELLRELDHNWNRLAPVTLTYEETAPNAQKMNWISNQLREFYFGSKTEMITSKFYQNLTNIYSDRYFVQCINNGINLMAKWVPTYPYIFAFKGSYSYTKLFGVEEYLGTTHVDECHYLFNTSFGHDPKFTAPEHVKGSKSEDMSKKMVKLFVSLPNNGVPKASWGEIQPMKLTDGNNLKYFHIDSNGETSIVGDTFKDRVNFWNNLPLFELNNEIDTLFDKKHEKNQRDEL